MAAYQYKTVVKSGDRLMAEEEMNALGQQGWELVNVLVVSRSATEMGRTVQKNFLIYFFKKSAG